ncbi:MAG: hypothetical protein L0Z62_39890, partial [Gemmataceae bacterium]|nr:hypothetical protein [Gemmataceae bacterium]
SPDRATTEGLASCVRQHRAARSLLPGLLRSANPRVREVGRGLLLPELGDRLAGEQLSATELRRQLNQVCPAELIDETILLCQGLAPLGVASAVVEECLQALQAERPVECSECGQRIPQGEYDAHLRRAHHVYEYRGQRRSFEETVGVLLEALTGASPDYESWAALERATRDEHGEQADTVLAGWLAQKLLSVPPAERGQVAGAMAEAVARGDGGAHLVSALAATGTSSVVQAAGALLALECVARLPAPLPSAAVESVRPLLADRRLPRATRDSAAAALLRTTGKSGPAALLILRAFATSGNKAAALERLQRLEGRVGQAEAIDALRTELEDQVRMSCPRCKVELLRPEMVEHLWDHHRLVLDGRRVREPWRVIEDWVADYKLEKDPEVLARCQALASRLDPQGGPRRLGQILLRQGIENAEALRQRAKEARQQGASVCPRCYALVPPPGHEPPGAVYVGQRGLSSGSYRVELRDGGLAPRLEVRAPSGWIHCGREPGSRRTRTGALLLLAGPLLLAAGVLAFVELPLDLGGLPPWAPAAGVGGLGLLLALLILLLWPRPGDPRQRGVNHAWTVLVPRLHRDGFSAEGLAFVAGLAGASRERGDVSARAASLPNAIEAAQKAAQADPRLGVCAGLLARLEAEDRARAGEDPVPLLAERLVGCVQGDLPLGFATGLLGPREGPAWTELERRRLRVLLCARAFEAGLGADDVIESSRICEALGLVLGNVDAEALARVRLLWSLRDERPWDLVGPATTVFDLATVPAAGEGLLAEYPDLLLAPAGDDQLYVTARGVCLAGVHMTEKPERVELVRREREFVVVAGRQRFRFEDDPGDLAQRLEGWLRWYFRSFLPGLTTAGAAGAPEAARKRRQRNALTCPECGVALLPCVGAVGVATQEGAAARPAVVETGS